MFTVIIILIVFYVVFTFYLIDINNVYNAKRLSCIQRFFIMTCEVPPTQRTKQTYCSTRRQVDVYHAKIQLGREICMILPGLLLELVETDLRLTLQGGVARRSRL